MPTELIMREDILGGFANASAAQQAGMTMNSRNQMPNVASRLATMQTLAGKNRRMNMRQGQAFVQTQKGRPIRRSRAGVPGAVPGGVRPVYGAQPTTAETKKRAALARTASSAIKKTKGSPEARAKRAVLMLIWLFTGKGQRKLNAEGQKVAKSIIMVASSRAKQNQFPALKMNEIEGLYKIATS